MSSLLAKSQARCAVRRSADRFLQCGLLATTSSTNPNSVPIWAREPVTLNRSLDHVERLVGVLYIYGIQASPQRKDLARLDFDVGGLP